MKKILTFVLVLAFAFSAIACAAPAAAPAAAEPAAEAAAPAAEPAADAVKTYKVGVCIYKFDDNFMTLYRQELETYLKDKGCEVTVVDGKNDQAEQTNQINTFIANGVDVLVVNLVFVLERTAL